MRIFRNVCPLGATVLLGVQLAGCGDSEPSGGAEHGGTAGRAGNTGSAGSSGNAGGSSNAGGPSQAGGTSNAGGAGNAGSAGDSSSAGTGGSAGSAGSSGSAASDEVAGWIDDYKAAHPGNGGKDWDINAKTPAEIAADPDAQRLLDLCGEDQRPVIPLLAWEYGGGDHPWASPEESPLVICVYIPVDPSSTHWVYDANADHVEADVYVKFPEQNPCKDEVGADQVLACLGDPSNAEILVDTASLNDGADAGLSLSEATTDLYLILPDDTRVHMYTGL